MNSLEFFAHRAIALRFVIFVYFFRQILNILKLLDLPNEQTAVYLKPMILTDVN